MIGTETTDEYKTKLFLATAAFPYGGGEKNFILPELEYLNKYFDITIITQINKDSSEEIMEFTEKYKGIKILEYSSTVKIYEYLEYVLSFLIYTDAREEIRQILRKRKNILSCIKESLSFYISARKYADFLKKNICMFENGIYYSYWYTHLCYGMVLCKKYLPVLKIMTRTHGVDLYNERYRGNRQPFKRQMDQVVNRVIFASEYGRQYYITNFALSSTDKKYVLCRLGSLKEEPCEVQKKRKEFVLVSCSYVAPLKRVELIIRALALVEEIEIHWIHFGNGNKFDEIRRMAKENLDNKENITYSLPGYIENTEIRRFYRENFVDCFITTTMTEGGCPMSIQEAMLFGIPIIATSVGGVTEMIDGNGVLLENNPTLNEICEAIKKIYFLGDLEQAYMRHKSREIWDRMFDIEQNAEGIITVLKNM